MKPRTIPRTRKNRKSLKRNKPRKLKRTRGTRKEGGMFGNFFRRNSVAPYTTETNEETEEEIQKNRAAAAKKAMDANNELHKKTMDELKKGETQYLKNLKNSRVVPFSS